MFLPKWWVDNALCKLIFFKKIYFKSFLFFFSFQKEGEQCDRDGFYSFHYLSIYNHEKLPNCIQKLPKSVAIFAKHWISHQKMAKDSLVYVKVAIFCQIWSHWRRARKRVTEIGENCLRNCNKCLRWKLWKKLDRKFLFASLYLCLSHLYTYTYV